MKTKIFITTFVFGILFSYFFIQKDRPPILEIYVFALKSGRAIFVRTSEDKRILIDGGSNSEIISHISKILPFYSRHIDIVICTSDVGKNIGGLIDVIERYDIGRFYLPKYTISRLGLASSTDKIYETLVNVANELNLNMDEVMFGRTIDLDSKTKLEVLFPADPVNFSYSKASPPEVLFNIFYEETDVLFVGNASSKVQKYIASTTIIKNSTSQSSDVLIVSHSALPDNVSLDFINKFHPMFLVYSKKIPKNAVLLGVKSTLEPSYENFSEINNRLTNKKKKDPLQYLLPENRFNLKEGGGIKVESDGKKIKVTSI